MYIIAEMAYSHDGSTELAKQIAHAASRAGANALSIHITDVETYMVPHYGTGAGRVSAGKEHKPIFQYLQEISLPFPAWKEVADTAKSLGLDLVIMPNDLRSLEYSQTLSPAAYVLSASCMQELEFVKKVAETQRPIFLRIGGSTMGEVALVIDVIEGVGNKNITLLCGHQNYPTAVEDSHLNQIPTLQKLFGLPVGIADHIDADHDFAGILPLLAIPLGITCIEKHLTHDRAKKGEDFESAFNEEEFAQLVARSQLAEKALGRSHFKGMDASSERYRLNVRKRIVAAKPIAAGTVITAEMLTTKRSDQGLYPNDLRHVMGMKAIAAIEENQGIEFKHLMGA